MRITFVNHACVKIDTGSFSIVCDPWLNGPAFNAGWDLLVPTPIDVATVMDGVRYLWVSHEHPDHFVPKFFAEIADRYARTVLVLFHYTRDKRVKSLCESYGFKVVEMAEAKRVALGDGITGMCLPFEFYDSWLHLTDGHESVVNLNDCQLRDAETAKAAKLTGWPDVLLTQFSYASWKGGRSRVRYRALAARRKLEAVARQVRTFRPRFTIPFASLMYFSNEENAYMNDSLNTPRSAHEVIQQTKSSPIVMYPGDQWTVGAPFDNAMSLSRYDELFSRIPQLPLRSPGASVPLAELERLFDAHRKKVFSTNSRALVNLLRFMPGLGAFHPVKILLNDLDVVVRVSLIEGFHVVETTHDASMHSSSLAFVFKHEFGYDTLLVNSRFEATPEGFSRMSRSLGIGLFNAMGFELSPRTMFNRDFVRLALSQLSEMRSHLKGTEALPAEQDSAQ